MSDLPSPRHPRRPTPRGTAIARGRESGTYNVAIRELDVTATRPPLSWPLSTLAFRAG